MTRKPPPLLGIRHVALKVKDIKRSEEFYTRLLGFKVEWRPDPRNLYLTSGSDNLALHEALLSFGEPQGTLDHFGFVVKLPDQVDEWAAYLKVEGITLVQEAKTHRDGARSIYFKDLDGNLIQVMYHPPISSPG